MMAERQITINSRKYDGHIRRTWPGGLISESEDMLVVVGRFREDVQHDDLGLIKEGTISFEHFWLRRWYNIFRFHEPDGQLRNYYCNITMPPTFADDVIDYVDLDLDVIVWPDKGYEVLDRDDLEKNTIKYGYPDEVVANAERSLAELINLIESGGLP
jgi:protein associated with RNAse G/E